MSQDYGDKPAFNMTVMNLQRNGGPNPCWGAGTSGGAAYPAPRQVGLGRVTGARGNDSMAYTGDSEPAYIWNNTGPSPVPIGISDYGPGQESSCTGSTYDTSANYIKAERDYFVGTPKPGYAKYTSSASAARRHHRSARADQRSHHSMSSGTDSFSSAQGFRRQAMSYLLRSHLRALPV